MNTFRLVGYNVRYADAAFFVVVFAFLYLHLFFLPCTPIYYEMDHVALLNDAKRMYGGEVIYRDFFEFTFPGSHSLYVALFYIFGPKYAVANLVILLHGLAAALLGLVISRRVISDNAFAYLPPAIYLFFGFRWFGIDGEHRMLSPIFALIAIVFLLDKKTYGRIAAAGVSCALSSFFTQQRGVLAAAGIAFYLLIEIGFRERSWSRLLKSYVVLGAVFTGSLGLMVLPFAIAAGPDRFFDSTILFLFSYVKDPSENNFHTLLNTIVKIRSSGVLMTVVAIFYHLLVPGVYAATGFVLWLRRKNENFRPHKSVLLVLCVGLLLVAGTLAPSASRIYQVALPAVILLVWLTYNIKYLSPRVAAFAAVLLAGFGITLAIRLQIAWDVKILATPSGRLAFISPVELERYQWLLDHTAPGDLVYETYNSHVNFPLGLPNPSAISVLLNSGYTPPGQVARAIEDLKRTKARYIIWDGVWTDEMESLGLDEKLKPFYIFLRENYRLRQSFTPYDLRKREVWERMPENEN